MISKVKLAALAACGCLTLIFPVARADDPFAHDIRTTEANAPADEQKMFHLPPGFVIQLVASEPEIGKPLNMQFDEKGRLWLTETNEYPFPANPPTRPKLDKIAILSDFGDDGHARSIQTFADGLDIPIGIYPLIGGGCIAHSIPKIWHFYDDNHNDKASRVVPLYGDFNTTDTHGMTNAFRRGFDGWIYANHGFSNLSTVKGSDGQAFTMKSGNTYRFKIDGTHAEQWTWGQINPFGAFFDPLGNRYDSDSHSKPFYQLLRGGHYEAFDRPDDILGQGPRMMNHFHGSTAIAGACGYFAEQFPEEYRGNFFVGNVVTCRINRDTITHAGSSPIATEAPDFLYTDDPWFRPNGIELGPDGALYVSDFYNKIIGHYEVPLTNPQRDYKRGRIWRIVYTGDKEHAPLKTPRDDWGKLNVDVLIADLNNPNLWVRMIAMNEIADRVGPPAADALKKVMTDGTAIQKYHALWDLRRIGALTDDILKAAASDKDAGVRVHAMRVLADMDKWNEDEHALAIAGLADSDALAQRCAADALGLHPSFDNLRPLLDLREKAPATDTHLVYTLRLAIRDHCKIAGTLPQLEKSNLSPADMRAIMDIAPGVDTAEAADFLIDHLDMAGGDNATLAKYVRSAVSQIQPDHLDAVVQMIRKNFSDDVDLQLELLKSLQEGILQRSGTLSPAARSWGEELAREIFSAKAEADAPWTNHPLDNAKTHGNPWTLQQRNSADGNQTGWFLTTSFNEPMTGRLTSKPFEIPAKLTFFLAGHNGDPSGNPPPKNFFRLRDAETDKILREALPPRNDQAKQVSWDLSDVAGKKGYLEAYDGDEGGAYAWLAFGRLDPPVVAMPKTSPSALPRRQATAAELVGTWHLDSLKDPMTATMNAPSTDDDLRRSLAMALLKIGSEDGLPVLKTALANPAISDADAATIATALGTDKTPTALAVLIDSFKTATDKLQMTLATALTGSPEGSEALMTAIQAGKAPARLLQEQNVRDRLAASKVNDLDARMKLLTRGMAAPNEAIQKLVDQRRLDFAAAHPTPDRGFPIFQKNCMVCHSLEGQGKLIGPQLDGIGQRGPNRVIEDVLDPNRNVDPAFRYSTLILKDETVITGLQKRTEGETLYFADSTGKEIAVQKGDIKKRIESKSSLMPTNFAEVIKPDDFNDLIAFLMTKRVAPGGAAPAAPAAGH